MTGAKWYTINKVSRLGGRSGSGSLWRYITCDWQIRNPSCPFLGSLSALLPMGMGAGHERAAGMGSTMRVPDSCELETTADLQIPGEITPYRLMPTALFFSFFPCSPTPGDLNHYM